jgi:hypothetical protein
MPLNSTQPPPILPFCAELRSKQIIMNLDFHPSGIDNPGTGCWCFRTMQVFGPDGGIAGKDVCTAGRTCYTPPEPNSEHHSS